MGTDVFLKWDDMSEEDEEKQTTWLSIDAGGYGYLRASVNMEEENKALLLLFADKIWRSSEAVRYDFRESYDLMMSLVKSYLNGKKIDVQHRLDSQIMIREVAFGALNEITSSSGVTVIRDRSCNGKEKKLWAISLIEFFNLGVRLQNENKHPKVKISW